MKTLFRPEMVSHEACSYSPSAGKPAEVVNDLLKLGIIQPHDILSFQPATHQQLAMAHSKDYVAGIFDGTIHNGFGNTSAQLADSTLYTVGSMIAACEEAVTTREQVLSPTSGFHHAGHAFGGGFCTFNGLMVAAMAMKQAGLVDTVAIVDCDAHYGNGTADIIDHLGLKWVQHHTAGAYFHDASDAKRYASWLRGALKKAHKADLVIYQAGADPHISDPLGGILTSKQMMERDLDVHLSLQGKPLVWNLAGGYQRDASGGIGPVLKLHRTTAEIMVGRYD